MGFQFRLCLFLLCFGPAWLGAVEVVEGPRVEVAGTSATVSWKTDVPAGATVRFGLNESLLNRRAEAEAVSTLHQVRLDGLKPGARYFYSVGTARRPLREGSFLAVPGAAAGAARAPRAAAAPPAAARPAAGEAKPAGPAAAPPARQTWGAVATLRDHYERHGRDFAATSSEDYAAQAWHFLQRAKAEGLPAKLDPDGTLRVWDHKTRAFAAYNRNGLAKTYFKPDSPGYFDRQPGRPVRLKPDATPDGR